MTLQKKLAAFSNKTLFRKDNALLHTSMVAKNNKIIFKLNFNSPEKWKIGSVKKKIPTMKREVCN